MSWWASQSEDESCHRFALESPSGALVEMSGFFSSMGDAKKPVMGCLQRARFRLLPDGRILRHPEEIPKRFAALCRWNRPDGKPGGFSYSPLLWKRLGAAAPEPAPADTPVDFSLDGLEWLVVRVDIHDFVRSIPSLAPLSGLLSRFVKEAALVVVHRNYAAQQKTDGRSVSSFGYSFLPVAPEPSPFGFGPGHFGAAIKQFRFSTTADGELEVALAFVVVPRSEKVLDLGGFDPVYSTVALLDRLSFGRLRVSRRAHDRLDAVMLRLHGRVHHRLFMEMESRWD